MGSPFDPDAPSPPAEAVRRVKCPQCGNEDTRRLFLMVPSIAICEIDLGSDGRLHASKPQRHRRNRAESEKTVFHCAAVIPLGDGKLKPCQHEWPVPKWILREMVW